MRFVVLLFGLVGVLMTSVCAVGLSYLFNTSMDSLSEYVADEYLSYVREPLTGVRHNDAALVLFLAAGYGLLGTFFSFLRYGKQGGVLLLVPVMFAALMNPLSLAFTWLQAFAGLLSFFVSPLPLNPPKEKDDDEE